VLAENTKNCAAAFVEQNKKIEGAGKKIETAITLFAQEIAAQNLAFQAQLGDIATRMEQIAETLETNQTRRELAFEKRLNDLYGQRPLVNALPTRTAKRLPTNVTQECGVVETMNTQIGFLKVE